LVDGLAKELGLNATVPYRPWFEDKQVRLLVVVTCCNCNTFHQQLSLAFISVQIGSIFLPRLVDGHKFMAIS
jgi:hypothetical protein